MSYLPLVLIAVVLVGMMTLTRRNRQRALTAQHQQQEQIRFGTEVMTTSGLYGTVIGLNDDETVQLSIAPGVEVKWALAAVRDVASLPQNTASRATPDESGETSDPTDPTGPAGPAAS